MAISRKGNVGNEHAPASSPAVAHRRAKRTEWRMRGIEPYNKIIVVFPSSVLPSRCFGNPPSPEGEGLIGCVHPCHLGALVEKSHTIETRTIVHVTRRDEGVPPLHFLTDSLDCHAITPLLPFLRLCMRCGVRDTAASVPTTFLYFFFAKKSTYPVFLFLFKEIHICFIW